MPIICDEEEDRLDSCTYRAQILIEKVVLKRITVIKCGKFYRRGRLLYKCLFKLMLFWCQSMAWIILIILPLKGRLWLEIGFEITSVTELVCAKFPKPTPTPTIEPTMTNTKFLS